MPNFTTDVEVANAAQVLGLDPDLAVSDKEVRAAFVRELRKLSRRASDNPTGLSHQQPAVAKIHAATLTDAVAHVNVHGLPDARASRVKQLVAAYKFMLKSGSRARVRYAQFDAVTPDGLLGELKMESPFANRDVRHQEFAFSDPSALPLTERSVKSESGFNRWDKFDIDVRPGDPPTNGTSVEFRLSISFQEALVGCTKTIRYTREAPCKACDGSGDQKAGSRKCASCRGRGRFEVPSGTYLIKKDCASCGATGKVPPPLCKHCHGTGTTASEESDVVTIQLGTVNGTVIKLRNRGNAGRRGGHSGDLMITVLVAAHRLLHRVQDDLHIAVPVPLSVALLGGRVEVPKADGDTMQVVVPPGVSSGHTIAVPGFGAPRVGTPGHFGDLRVHLIVVTPNVDRLTKSQRHALLDYQATETPIELTPELLSVAKAQFRQWLPKSHSE